MRPIRHRYRDPLDLVWLACARELGLTVTRSDEVFAAYDGAGTLTLGEADTLDPDDSLGQMVFHEICHALVAGEGALQKADFGLENTDDRDLVAEHACHRLQATLADAHGLRDFFAVTTDHRPYWDALPVDPLGMGDDPAVSLAREAYARAQGAPWREPLQRALSATATIAATVRPLTDDSELWGRTRAVHRAGFPLGDSGATCAECAWAYPHGRGLRCRQTRVDARRPGARIAAEDAACVRFEAPFDEQTCAACGACCREGFHRVELRRGDVLRQRHPQLVVVDSWGAHLPRPDGRCVALSGDGEREAYRCRVYGDRPRNCRELALASDACLEARRRVGCSA